MSSCHPPARSLQSEYELARQAKIAQNKALMQKLGLDQTVEGLKAEAEAGKKKKKKKTPAASGQPRDSVPPRRSARLNPDADAAPPEEPAEVGPLLLGAQSSS